MKALIATIALIASANALAWDSGFAGGFMNGLNSARGVQTQQPRSNAIQFTDSRGMPAGSAWTNGNHTTFTDSRGMPAGSAWTSNGTTTFTDSRGMPAGSAYSW